MCDMTHPYIGVSYIYTRKGERERRERQKRERKMSSRICIQEQEREREERETDILSYIYTTHVYIVYAYIVVYTCLICCCCCVYVWRCLTSLLLCIRLAHRCKHLFVLWLLYLFVCVVVVPMYASSCCYNNIVVNDAYIVTGWRRLIGSPKLQIIFHKRATKYRSLLWKMTYKDKGSYESSPPCTTIERRIHRSIVFRCLPLHVYKPCIQRKTSRMYTMEDISRVYNENISYIYNRRHLACIQWKISSMYTIKDISYVYNTRHLACIQWKISYVYTIKDISYVYNARHLASIQWKISYMYTIKDISYVYNRGYLICIQCKTSRMYTMEDSSRIYNRRNPTCIRWNISSPTCTRPICIDASRHVYQNVMSHM